MVSGPKKQNRLGIKVCGGIKLAEASGFHYSRLSLPL
jgi:hypothetical protein